ncbi:MAG TPA: carboxypeptidase regulatory-like domain-containing protein [Gemmatimonadales bacterium]|nr:carboxypeptidase regulatory-like domain-containing protein [Gemmatimonadales bacterium]
MRDAATGTPLSGVRVTIPGTGIAVLTDAAGAYELSGVSPGALSVEAALAGYVSSSANVTLEPGAAATVNLSLAAAPAAAAPEPAAVAPAAAPTAAPTPVTPSKPDEELATGRWTQLDKAEAEALLGQPLAVIGGLWVESVSRAAGTARPRIRVAQLTPSGERVALVETRSGAPPTGEPRLTALRIMPPSEAYPVTTGTGSFGNLLVTATTSLPPDSLRALLGRLVQAPR